MRKQTFQSWVLVSAIILLAGSMFSAFAEKDPYLGSEPHRLMADTAEKVLNLLESGADPVKEPKKFNQQMFEVLDPVVAFDIIAKGVMGTYFEQASPEQRQQFTEILSKVLYTLKTV